MEIKACPFCGARIEQKQDLMTYSFVCTNNECGAEVTFYLPRQEAQKRWNRRNEVCESK